MSTTVEAVERESLTEKQAAILSWWVERWGQTGSWPAIREACAHFKISSPNGINCHLKALVKKGYLVRIESCQEVDEGEDKPQVSRGYAVPELLRGAEILARAWLAKLAVEGVKA